VTSAARAVKSKGASAGSEGGERPALDTGKHLASALFKPTGNRHKKHPVARKVAKVAAKKALGKLGQNSVDLGAGAVRALAEGAGTLGRQTIRGGLARVVERRPPVQASVDVAAPVHVVWDEWMTFEWFTEGLHRIEEVERDGDALVGRTAGPEGRDWRAEIVDERERQAFAWRSEEGTDCAGLVTFHELGERLTRVEADLDVLPTNPAEALLLTLNTPAKRAQRELQRFKAAVEFINPDAYENEEPEGEQDPSSQAEQDQSSPGEQEESDNDNDGRETRG
jgi:uncharacterized membrane protein